MLVLVLWVDDIQNKIILFQYTPNFLSLNGAVDAKVHTQVQICLTVGKDWNGVCTVGRFLLLRL